MMRLYHFAEPGRLLYRIQDGRVVEIDSDFAERIGEAVFNMVSPAEYYERNWDELHTITKGTFIDAASAVLVVLAKTSRATGGVMPAEEVSA